MHLSVNLRK